MVRKKACNSEQGKDLNTETLFFYNLHAAVFTRPEYQTVGDNNSNIDLTDAFTRYLLSCTYLPGVPTSFRQEFSKKSVNVTKSEKTQKSRESLFTF